MNREQILAKTNGHCAYCGKNLEKFQVDHFFPKRKAHWIGNEKMMKPIVEKGSAHTIDFDIDCEENLMPACARCNRWKSSEDSEQFREQIQRLTNGLKRDSAQFRMALDFGLIEITDNPVTFFYEDRTMNREETTRTTNQSEPSQVDTIIMGNDEAREPIENALYATGNFPTEQASELATGILSYIQDAGYKIVKN